MINGQLLQLLAARAEAGRPLRVGLIGAGKFGTMFLSQARRVAGLHVLGVADLSLERAGLALQRAGWPPEQFAARSWAEALKSGATCLTTDAEALIRAETLGYSRTAAQQFARIARREASEWETPRETALRIVLPKRATFAGNPGGAG